LPNNWREEVNEMSAAQIATLPKAKLQYPSAQALQEILTDLAAFADFFVFGEREETQPYVMLFTCGVAGCRLTCCGGGGGGYS
jgi:hypothetical protein